MKRVNPNNFNEFWPYYVCEHADRANRRVHFVGTALTLVFVVLASLRQNPWYLLGIPLAGYGMAWFGHFFIEKNRPATFKAPFYSLWGDYKMFGLMCLGRMDAEVERCRALTQGRRL